MSRFKRLAHSLLSGYMLLGANVLYTLASLPLALRYLDVPEFALWGLVSSIGQYVTLVDAGMQGTARILVDYKDRREEGGYGSVIQTYVLVSLVQAVIILLLGVVLAFGLVPLLRIPQAQQHEFVWLTVGQCVALAATFVSRILSLLLTAHQRYDLVNYTQATTFGVMLSALWLAFRSHQGVYSNIWAQLATWVVSTTLLGIWTLRLKLLPPKGAWGRPSWSRFRELFSYGRDVFLCAIGFQMLSASQTLVLTRGVGLEASAVWSACTRTYIVVSQLVFKVFDYSAAAIAEMIVRKEMQLLYRRFRSLAILSASFGVWVGAVFMVCNQPFVRLWTGGKFGWPVLNDALLGIWLVLQAQERCQLGLVGQTKQIHSMRYLYMLEGAFFICLAVLLVPRGGVPAMLLASIAATLLFGIPYGLWRTRRYFDVPWAEVALQWWLPPFRLTLCLVPLAAIVWWLVQRLPLRAQLPLCGGTVGVGGMVLLLRFGLDESLRQELAKRAPSRWRRLVLILVGR